MMFLYIFSFLQPGPSKKGMTVKSFLIIFIGYYPEQLDAYPPMYRKENKKHSNKTIPGRLVPGGQTRLARLGPGLTRVGPESPGWDTRLPGCTPLKILEFLEKDKVMHRSKRFLLISIISYLIVCFLISCP